MLKGHVQIELHNHKTGLRDRIEQDNLVTDAINMIANIAGVDNQAPNVNVTPIATKGLGGIFLFDNVLVENSSNVLFPDDAKLIASANQQLNTSDSQKGSINNLESGVIQNGYMNVWDFATSQANGIIKSMALTNIYGAVDPSKPVRLLDGDLYDVTNYGNVIGIDFENDEMYRIMNVDGAKITKNKFYSNHLPVDYTAGMACSLDNEVMAATTLSVAEKLCAFYEGDSYIIERINDNKIAMYRVNISDDYSTEQLWELERADVGAACMFTMAKGYYYITTTNRRTGVLPPYIIKKDIETGVETTLSIPRTDVSAVSALWSVGNGVVYGSYRSTATGQVYVPFLLYPDDTFIFLTQYTDRVGERHVFAGDSLQGTSHSFAYNSGRSRKGMINNYLGTICNLQTPVEKTASMSMKVKYSLTNV